MFGEQARESNRFATQVGADDGVGRRAMIAFAEDQVQGPLNYGEPKREVGRVGDIKEHPRFRQHLLRAAQTLLDRGGTADERAGNLTSPKAADELQYEHYLRRRRKPRMAARKHHAKLIVFDADRIEDIRDRVGQGPFGLQQSSQIRRKRQGGAFAPQHVDGAIPRGLHQPGRRVFRDAAELPNLQRATEGILDDVFCQRKIMNAECPREGGDHASRLSAKEMVAQLHSYMSICMTGRTSTEPSTSRIGQPPASFAACARSAATTTENPPTRSFASANGPSVTVPALPLTTLPSSSSGCPGSLRLPLAVRSFIQASHFCMICCDCSGLGLR